MRRGITATSLKSAGIGLVVAAATVWGAGPALADAYRLEYSVNHSKYGHIGNYTNTIDQEGGSATVKTNLNLKVKVLGISAYSQSADRIEKWNGDHLIYLHSTTTTNGKPAEVNAVAQGDHLQVTSPKGTEMAPADVKVSNPWSPAVLNGNMIITPDDGTVTRMQISAPQNTMVQAASGPVAAKEYNIDLPDLKKQYQVWFDSSGTPVKFDLVDSGSTVTFTLQSKTPVNPLVANAQAVNPQVEIAAKTHP
jgi:Family of unknown function (DUF6134)